MRNCAAAADRLSCGPMRRILFITGTDTSVGKTVLTAWLARWLIGQGLKTAAFKPVCSGGRADARTLHAALGGALTLDEINPWHFRAPIAPSLAARRERQSVSLAQVLAHIRARQRDFDVTLVEGAGGLLSPLGRDFDSRNLLVALRAAPVIVAPNRLGVINQLLLTLEALPKGSRAKTSIALMSPVRPDSATAANAGLLGEFSPPSRVFVLPQVGGKDSPAHAGLNPRLKRILAALIDA